MTAAVKKASNRFSKRSGADHPLMRCSSVLTLESGRSLSTAHTALETAGAKVMGSERVRASRFMYRIDGRRLAGACV